MKIQDNTTNGTIPGLTRTSIALALVGVINSGSTWMRGYQGGFERMMLDLVAGFTLGMISALLYQIVNVRHRQVARVIVWGSVAYGARVALETIASDAPVITTLKVVSAGALYGAFLAGIVVAVVSAITTRFLKVPAPSDV